jgi:hypothetical protein
MYRGLSDALLPVARKQIRKMKADSGYSDFFISSEENEIIIKEVYENYTAAFGMIVNQSGFQTGIAIYSESKEETQSEGNRKLVLNLLFEILKQEKLVKGDFETLKDIVLDGDYPANYEELFNEASIALKRALRSYKIQKK